MAGGAAVGAVVEPDGRGCVAASAETTGAVGLDAGEGKEAGVGALDGGWVGTEVGAGWAAAGRATVGAETPAAVTVGRVVAGPEAAGPVGRGAVAAGRVADGVAADADGTGVVAVGAVATAGDVDAGADTGREPVVAGGPDTTGRVAGTGAVVPAPEGATEADPGGSVAAGGAAFSRRVRSLVVVAGAACCAIRARDARRCNMVETIALQAPNGKLRSA